MNLVKNKSKKRQKDGKTSPAAASTSAAAPPVEMETFDDFLNTLTDDDEEEDVEEVAEEEDSDSGSGSEEDEEANGGSGVGDDLEAEADSDDDDQEDDEDVEEEELDMEEDIEEEDQEEIDKDDDDDDEDSLDLNAELEKSLEDVKSGAHAQAEVEDEEEDEDVDYFVREEEPDDESTKEETASSLKKSLAALQDTDPDFFDYLKKNDADLLDFGTSDDEGEGEEGDSSEEDDDEDGDVHRPPAELEVASDSEAESEEEQVADKSSAEYKAKVANYLKRRIVNLSVISHWQTQLSTTRDMVVFGQVVDAFESAVEIVLQDKDAGDGNKTKWKVEGSSNFNALIRLCIRHVFGFCTRYLCATNNATFAAKAFTKAPMEVRKKNDGRWTKLRAKLRTYMNTLVQFLRSMGNPEAVTSVLRHCQTMAGFWALFTTKAQKLLRTLISIWSAGEDSARIAAFVTILRMSNYNQEFFLAKVLKQMYIAFVSNCKFTTPNSWPAINFMRASLVEVYLVDTSLAYTIAFPFVRQLAIHLRNAIMAGSENADPKKTAELNKVIGDTEENSKGGSAGKGKQRNRGARARGVTADGVLGSKKEATRIVVSWQFLHSIHLWAALLGEASAKGKGSGDDNLRLLIHPIVMIALGTVRLVPTRKFIPLRFHIAKVLTELQSKSGVFIPLLPLALEVLSLTDFSYKTAGKFTVRPLNLQCCLKADPAETGYHKAVADAIYDAVLAVCQVLGSDIAFPELVTPPLHIIKNFLKNKCKNGEVARRFKTLVEKIEANSKFINEKRASAMDAGLVHLGDEKSVQVLRIEIENSSPPPPIIAFAQDWRQMHAKQMAKLQRAAIGGGGGGRDGKYGGSDETREERLIPKSSAKTAASGKRSQGAKKRAQMEKVMFADDDDDDGSGGSGNDSEVGGSSEEEYRTKFDVDEEELAEEPEPLSKKPKNKKKKRTLPEEVPDDEDLDSESEEAQPQKKKSKGKAAKKIAKKGKSKAKAGSGRQDQDDDMQDEIVDFDDFGDSD